MQGASKLIYLAEAGNFINVYLVDIGYIDIDSPHIPSTAQVDDLVKFGR